MSLKVELLNLLKQHEDVIFSGEELAQQFQVTRAAVWKAVNSLKKEGIQIESHGGKGYSFLSSNDLLNEQEIASCLDKEMKVIVFDSIDSTNLEAKRQSIKGLSSDLLIVANEQTAGKGRRGNSFYSPARSGVYLSYITKVDTQIAKVLPLTIAAAVACKEAISNCTGVDVGIKWVNDLYLNNKKVGGILCEATMNFETQEVDSIIVGIGINASTKEFPKELQNKAGNLGVKVSRNLLTASIINRLTYWMEHLEESELLDSYRNASILTDKMISYEDSDGSHQAIVLSIDDEGHLVVKEKEKITVLSNGEVHIVSFDDTL